MTSNSVTSIPLYDRERARRHRRHTVQEMRRTRTIILPRAKNGSLEELFYFCEGVHEFPGFIITEIFEAFLEQLKASKIPPIETNSTTSDSPFKDLKVQRAVQALRGLGNALPFLCIIQSKHEIGDLIVSRWPDVLGWMWYLYVSCYENNFGNRNLKRGMHRWLCTAFGVGCNRDSCSLAIAEVPGSIRLATLLCMLDTQGLFLTKEDAFFGTFTLVNFLRVEINKSLLDDVLEALGGDAELFMDTAIARLEDALDTPETADNTVSTYANIFIMLDSIHVIDHPIWIALRAKRPVVILTNIVRRMLGFLTEANSARFGPDFAGKSRQLIATHLERISIILQRDSDRTILASQALQAGIMTALIDCATLAFTFKPFDRDTIVDVLKQLTWHSTHLLIARLASMELEKLERTCSVQGRFDASTHDVRKAWVALYDAILARRTILAQMQALNSTPMACDNCFKFDERANFKKCAGCGMAHYCSRDCQSRAWRERGHRTECKAPKYKPAKNRRRATNQEKYFLARVAVNDAQHKKEQLEQMARLGLKKLSVSVDYTISPPRCLVECAREELYLFSKETADMMEIAREWLDRCMTALKNYPGDPNDIPKSIPYTEVPIPDGICGDENTEGSEHGRVRTTHIQLVDDNGDAQAKPPGSGFPPIHLTVRLPGSEGEHTPRREYFVIDDFWEFVQIKFEDLYAEDFPEMDERDKYKIAPHSYPPDVQAFMQWGLAKESRKASAEKELAGRVAQQQDDLSRTIKALSDSRSTAVESMREAYKVMLILNLA
ncbi:hypothetical protein SCHPADRAFT_945546 [Schizopora paradoxa]|uniref:MYND-type domain-containing protein n=1 Tax=Schizopora paradoxa TaxID=27342 RepID=A0A0H2RCA9_9AGAM|nr:hypothetical protein SCHPADRAFT_945546 [Schizopora paradoxa]